MTAYSLHGVLVLFALQSAKTKRNKCCARGRCERTPRTTVNTGWDPSECRMIFPATGGTGIHTGQVEAEWICKRNWLIIRSAQLREAGTRPSLYSFPSNKQRGNDDENSTSPRARERESEGEKEKKLRGDAERVRGVPRQRACEPSTVEPCVPTRRNTRSVLHRGTRPNCRPARSVLSAVPLRDLNRRRLPGLSGKGSQ
ncbi:hypothetical protein VTO42DRAFT_6204 [Malbranchea cinnamomea]